VTNAINAANSVERSQSKHHGALVSLIVACASMSEADAFATLSLYTVNRFAKAPDTLATKATNAWLEKHFGVFVNKDGVAQKGKTWTGKGFTVECLDRAKAEPWYNLARDLAFKVPAKIALMAAASSAARLQHTGTPLPSKDELYAEFIKDVASVKAGSGHAKWVAEYNARKEAGTLPQAEIKAA
jgi:hypothetical protein